MFQRIILTCVSPSEFQGFGYQLSYVRFSIHNIPKQNLQFTPLNCREHLQGLFLPLWQVFQEVKNGVLQAGGASYRHGLRCKSGRHRAVAVGELVLFGMQKAGFTVDIVHMHCSHDNKHSRPPCGCPDHCNALDKKWHMTKQAKAQLLTEWRLDRDVAFALAVRLWNTV